MERADVSSSVTVHGRIVVTRVVGCAMRKKVYVSEAGADCKLDNDAGLV